MFLPNYLSSPRLKALASHDDAEVRHLVETCRQLAAELLLARMQRLSAEHLGDRNDPEAPKILWDAVQKGPQVLGEDVVHELTELSGLADGWWKFSEGDPELVSLEVWAQEYGATG